MQATYLHTFIVGSWEDKTTKQSFDSRGSSKKKLGNRYRLIRYEIIWILFEGKQQVGFTFLKRISVHMQAGYTLSNIFFLLPFLFISQRKICFRDDDRSSFL